MTVKCPSGLDATPQFCSARTCDFCRSSDAAARIYPCAECGTMRSAAEGGTTFTVCDACWDKLHPKPSACDCGGFPHGKHCAAVVAGLAEHTPTTPCGD